MDLNHLIDEVLVMVKDSQEFRKRKYEDEARLKERESYRKDYESPYSTTALDRTAKLQESSERNRTELGKQELANRGAWDVKSLENTGRLEERKLMNEGSVDTANVQGRWGLENENAKGRWGLAESYNKATEPSDKSRFSKDDPRNILFQNYLDTAGKDVTPEQKKEALYNMFPELSGGGQRGAAPHPGNPNNPDFYQNNRSVTPMPIEQARQVLNLPAPQTTAASTPAPQPTLQINRKPGAGAKSISFATSMGTRQETPEESQAKSNEFYEKYSPVPRKKKSFWDNY
jgi:hypothetical protein